MIKLYAIAVSTACAKVRALLRLKAIKFEEVEPHSGSYRDAYYRQLVVAGSVPAIIHDDFILHDSNAIAAYLDSLVSEPNIWAQHHQQHARQIALIGFHDTRLDPAIRRLFPHVKGLGDSTDLEDINQALAQLLLQLSKLLEQGGFVDDSNQLHLLQCSYAPSLALLDKLVEHLKLELTKPSNIVTWQMRMQEQEILADEVSGIHQAMDDWVAKVSPSSS